MKPITLLAGSGGITDRASNIFRNFKKFNDFGEQKKLPCMITSNSPESLVRELLKILWGKQKAFGSS